MSYKEKLPTEVYPGQLICPLYHTEEDSGSAVVYRFVPGPGVMIQKYTVNGQPIQVLSATLLGTVKINEESIKNDDSDEKPSSATLNVNSEKDGKDGPNEEKNRLLKNIIISVSSRSSENDSTDIVVDDDFANHLPKEGDIVLTRVTRISLQRANVEILAVENNASPIDSGCGSKGSNPLAPKGGSTSFSISQASSDLGETFRGVIRAQDVRASDRDRVKITESFKPGDIVRAQVLSLGDGSNYYMTTARNDLGVVFAKASNGAGELMYAIDWETMIAPSTGTAELRKCAKPF
ncbi:exosome non-catalytic core subunit CSL4 Ecym_6482 [Eremothecium cymbalariae DBVPG|uniref:Uncharacterized protein n=1 Tax=Eremothecium cymbalariae (strain CBS 270.75 / DBVPG 7215 / KCTC 17166 / NRRL Y-17582) TaxID=931890 RepID=G8JUS2_ERECY|nr:hypothetical protein Ecym_6482 [Eremothecium cymbalariae DBVPG\